MNNLITPSENRIGLCAELVRRKILQRLKCPANLVNYNLAIHCVRNGRTTFRYGHELLADILGYWRTPDAKRKAIQRRLQSWFDYQRDSGYRLQEIRSGGCRTKKITTYGIDHIQPVVEWIRQQVATDPERGLALPEVLIDRYLEEAISRLPQTACSLSLPKRKQATATSRGETSISRDSLTPVDPPSEMCLVALNYRRQGYKVFPANSVKQGVCSCKLGSECQNKGKHPRITGWQNWAEAAGETQIRELWGKYPDANVAIKTGGTLAVVDVDPRSWGHIEWPQLVEYHSIEVPETLKVKTGSGASYGPALPEKIPASFAAPLMFSK